MRPYRRLMTLYEPFLTDNIYPGALLNALCHPVILNHIQLHHKLSLYPNVRGGGIQKQSLKCGVNVCADEYDGTDKETETKPDVVFLGVSLESVCRFFLFAELSCLSKAPWELSSPTSSR